MSTEEIMQLSQAERILLVGEIWDSIDKENIKLTLTQKAELDKRLERHRAGETTYFTLKEVRSKAESNLNDL